MSIILIIRKAFENHGEIGGLLPKTVSEINSKIFLRVYLYLHGHEHKRFPLHDKIAPHESFPFEAF